jgi:molybdopterin converting factor small subunit
MGRGGIVVAPGSSTTTVVVEFYGIARLRAGRPEISLEAGTLGELLRQLEQSCPGLGRLVTERGDFHPGYLVSLDGKRFVADGNLPLEDGARVLLLGADAGG